MDEENGVPATEEQEELESLKQKFEDQRKRAEKAENELKELSAALEAAPQEQEPAPLPAQETTVQFDDLAAKLSVLKPLEEDEIEELQSQAKNLGVDPIKLADSPTWKAHLTTLRASKQAETKTPESSHRTAVFEGKTYAEVVTDPEASQDAKETAYKNQIDSILKRGRNQMI